MASETEHTLIQYGIQQYELGRKAGLLEGRASIDPHTLQARLNYVNEMFADVVDFRVRELIDFLNDDIQEMEKHRDG